MSGSKEDEDTDGKIFGNLQWTTASVRTGQAALVGSVCSTALAIYPQVGSLAVLKPEEDIALRGRTWCSGSREWLEWVPAMAREVVSC
jgi:hypothetical protein